MPAKPNENPQLKIGENIKKWRVFKNCKQQTLANHLNLSKAAISNIENDKSDICLSRMEAIANYLGISVLQLFSTPEDTLKNKDQAGTNENLNSFTQEVIKGMIVELQHKDEIIIRILTDFLNKIAFLLIVFNKYLFQAFYCSENHTSDNIYF